MNKKTKHEAARRRGCRTTERLKGGVAEKLQGLYALQIRLKEGQEITVGALGKGYFPRGIYVYIGSAQKGLQARIKRHLARHKRLFWHIDYLLEKAEVIGVKSLPGTKEDECRLSEEMSQCGGRMVMKGFGSSDCSCPTHLYYFGRYEKHQVKNKSREKEKV
jgi:Uri superfamily endonuclease